MKMRQLSRGEAMATTSELSPCPLLRLTCRGTRKATCSKAGETNKEPHEIRNQLCFLFRERKCSACTNYCF